MMARKQTRRIKVLKKPDGAVALRHLSEHAEGFRVEYQAAMSSLEDVSTHWNSATKHLNEIKTRKLYRLECATLDEYADKHLGVSGRRLRQILAHERFVAQLMAESDPKGGKLSTAFGERPALELDGIKDTDKRKEAAKLAVDLAEREGALQVETRHARAAAARILDDADREARPDVDAMARAIESEGPLHESQNSLRAIKQLIQQLAQTPMGAYINLPGFESAIEDAWRVLRFSRPFGICPYCGGDRCDSCKRSGWMPRDLWSAAPSEMQERVAHR